MDHVLIRLKQNPSTRRGSVVWKFKPPDIEASLGRDRSFQRLPVGQDKTEVSASVAERFLRPAFGLAELMEFAQVFRDRRFLHVAIKMPPKRLERLKVFQAISQYHLADDRADGAITWRFLVSWFPA